MKCKITYCKTLKDMNKAILIRTYKKLSRAVRDPRVMSSSVMDKLKQVYNIIYQRYGNELWNVYWRWRAVLPRITYKVG